MNSGARAFGILAVVLGSVALFGVGAKKLTDFVRLEPGETISLLMGKKFKVFLPLGSYQADFDDRLGLLGVFDEDDSTVYEFLAGGDEVGYESVIRFTNDAGESYDVTVKVKRGTP